jgi:FAD:protein FMN transferase
MKRILLFTILFTWLATGASGQTASFDTTLLLMGTRFELKAVGASKELCRNAVLAGINEVERINRLLSTYLPNTQTSAINANAGISPVKADDELFAIIVRSNKISKLTDGAFDITFGPMYSVWKFDGNMSALPHPDSIQKYRELVGYEKIQLDLENKTVYLPQRGMSIGFGAIGKGYAANRAMKVMLDKGATGGFVNAAGDILFKGRNEKGEKWNVAIASPANKREMIGNLQVEEMAVVTSGNYEKNFKLNGKTYSHIIDPKTGYPVVETISVTIFCADAEMADALATAVSVLGVENGLKLINQLKGFECLIVDSQGTIHQSNHLTLQPFSK